MRGRGENTKEGEEEEKKRKQEIEEADFETGSSGIRDKEMDRTLMILQSADSGERDRETGRQGH